MDWQNSNNPIAYLKQQSQTGEDEFQDEPRSIEEIVTACDEFLDKIWFDRHLTLKYKIENQHEPVDATIWKGSLASAQRVIEKYGEDNLGPYSDFD